MATRKKRLMMNAFSMNCVSHLHHGLWGRAETRQLDYCSLDPWVELARILEAGCFDSLFLADVLGIYDIYGGGPEAAIREAMQVPVNDPALLIPAMAQATEHLGFAFTGSIYAEHPYNFARSVSTLDHLTRGRVGWNIVTSYLPGAAINLGYDALPEHDDRYDRGDDYLEVLYKLWEGSWEDDAVVRDRERMLYADPAKVHRIDHVGPYYQVPGPHLCEPSPQRTPLLFQAGSSERGREFAARHAECVFIAGGDAPRVAADIRSRAARYGREPDDIRVCLALSVIVGGTEAEARQKARDFEQTLSVVGGLVHQSGVMGVDFGSIDLDKPISDHSFNHVIGFLKSMIEQQPDKTMTFRDLARSHVSGQWLVGSDEQIADQIEHFSTQGIDGFNLIYATTPGTFIDFIDGVAPILQRRGLMQTSYGDGTLREKVFGAAKLSARHPGAACGRSIAANHEH